MKYCHHCGGPVEETHHFCRQCGRGLGVPPATALQAAGLDHRRHVRLLAILLLVWGGLGLLGAVGVMLAAGFMGNVTVRALGGVFPVDLIPSLLVILGWIFVGVSLAAVAAGVGLLDYQRWARPLAIAVCVLTLFRFPIGTILGAYGLWVLLSAAGQRHFQEMAAARS